MFAAVWELICNAFETALNILTNVFDIFAGIFTGDWDKVWNGIKGVFSSIWNSIRTTFRIVLNTILSISKTIFDKIKSAVTEKLNALKDTISNILETVKSFFTELPGKALDWGRNLISGFIDGIKSMASAVSDAVSGVIGNVANFLGFNSPAKKGEGRFIVHWGYNMIDGFLDGVNAALPLLNRTMNKVIPDINSAVDDINMSAESSIKASGAETQAMSGMGATEYNYETIINTEGLFKGAVLTVRDDSDIDKIVRLVLERLADFIAQKNRNAGLQGI